MFMVLSSWQSHCESSPGSFDERKWRQTVADHQSKPDDLGCESICTGCQSLHPPSPFIIITQPESWYSFYHPREEKAESTWLAGYILRWFTRPQMVTHSGTNRVWRGTTTLIEANTLPLSQPVNYCSKGWIFWTTFWLVFRYCTYVLYVCGIHVVGNKMKWSTFLCTTLYVFCTYASFN